MKRFHIRKVDTGQKTKLYVDIHKASPSIKISLCTKIEVNKEDWVSFTGNGEKPENWVRIGEEGGKQYEQIKMIDAAIERILDSDEAHFPNGDYDVSYIKAELKREIDNLDEERKRKKLEGIRKAQEAEEKRMRESDVSLYLDSYKERIERNDEYAEGTKKVWRTFLGQDVLGGFIDSYKEKNHTILTWDCINRELIGDFKTYLFGKGYADSTINKHLTNFRTFLSSGEEKHHIDLEKIFRKQKISGQKVKASSKVQVYLNEDEIQALYKMKLEGREELSRDLFLIGCYTAQAFAEFHRISRKDCVGEGKSPATTILMERKKTGTELSVPLNLKFKHNNIVPLLVKYDYNIKSLKVYGQKINEDIKVVLRRLSEKVPSLKEECETSLTKTEKELEREGKFTFRRNSDGVVVKPKYECVSTHTARRSGITNLVLTNRYSLYQIMKIAGHSDLSMTIQYVKASGKDVALFLEKHYKTNVADTEPEGMTEEESAKWDVLMQLKDEATIEQLQSFLDKIRKK